MSDTSTREELTQDLVDAFGEDPTNTHKLHPNLQPYLVTLPHIGVCLKHPLVFVVPFYSWKHANKVYVHKMIAVARAQALRNWGSLLALHERPHRLPTLHELWCTQQITLSDLQQLLPDTWRDTEFPHQFDNTPLHLFRAAGFLTDGPIRPTRSLTCWRGQRGDYPVGISWTSRKATARWFAKRFQQPEEERSVVFRTVVPPNAILARFNNRGEYEVVVDPHKLGPIREVV